MKHKVYKLFIFVLLFYILPPIKAFAVTGSEESKASIVFLGNQSLPPMVYVENGSPKGIVVDITKALGEKLGQPISIQAINWVEAQEIVAQGGADALIQINQTEERKKLYDFSEPLLESKFSIFVLSKRTGIFNAEDLRGLRVGVEEKGLPALVLEKASQVNLVKVPSILEAFQMLQAGNVDAVVVDEWVGEYLLAINGIEDVRITGEPIASSQSAIAVKKGNSQLLSQINQALQEIKEDGTYNNILDKWASAEIVYQTRDQIRLKQYHQGITILIIFVILSIVCSLITFHQLNKSKQMEYLLNQEKKRLSDIITATKVGTWEYNIETTEVIVNNRWAEIVGYTLKGLSPFNMESWVTLISPEDASMFNTQLKRVFAKELDYLNVECKMKHKMGYWVWVNLRGNVILWAEDGKPILISGTSTDITERKHWVEVLKESEEKYRLLTEHTSDVIWVYNLRKDKITYVSPAIFYLRGYTVEEALGESIEDAFTDESAVLIKDIVKRTVDVFIKNPEESNCYINEFRQPCKNGDVIWVEVSARYRYNSEEEIEVVGVSRNIDSRKKFQEEILYLSYHDQLTGLYNRRFFEEELKRLDTERNYPLTIVMSDVNGLKLINDSFGHTMGDELLRMVAKLLAEECRSCDIIARLGGDEFVILLPKTDSNQAEQLIKRFMDRALYEKVYSVNLSVSFGWETKIDDATNIQEIIKKAENQMYRRKLFESQKTKGKTIDAILHALYKKNDQEEQHSLRVSAISKHMGEVLELSENQIEQLKSVGLLHDIGKIAINEDLLNKPGELTEEEWKEIYRHPEVGYRLLRTVNDMADLAIYVLCHHERWDGKGYPKALKGEEIPYLSRIIAIVEAYEVMTSGRSYRDPMSEEATIEELIKNAGVQFDYELVKIFIEKILGHDSRL